LAIAYAISSITTLQVLGHFEVRPDLLSLIGAEAIVWQTPQARDKHRSRSQEKQSNSPALQ